MIQVDWNKLTTFHLDYKELFSILIDSKDGFPEQRARDFVRDHWYFAIQWSIVYVFLIFGIQFFMKNRQPFDLQRPLNVWNGGLAMFSVLGSIYMAPNFFGSIWKGGIRGSYCDLDGMMGGTHGFWMWLFVLSKVTDFIDTFFIVLRKRPLIFLHWYHHILTLICCFFSYPDTPAYNRWGIYLNVCVHALMYSYYFLRSLNVKLPGAVAKCITTSQIIQFIICVVILVFIGIEHFIIKSFDECSFHLPSFWLAAFMDITYLILFINFFLKSYVVRGGKDKYKMVVQNGNKKRN